MASRLLQSPLISSLLLPSPPARGRRPLFCYAAPLEDFRFTAAQGFQFLFRRVFFLQFTPVAPEVRASLPLFRSAESPGCVLIVPKAIFSTDLGPVGAPVPRCHFLDQKKVAKDCRCAGLSFEYYSGRTGSPGLFYLVPWVMRWFEKLSGIGLARGRHFLDQKKVAKDCRCARLSFE